MKTFVLVLSMLTATLSDGLVQAAGTLGAQDWTDIQQLYARYNIAIDGGDAEGMWREKLKKTREGWRFTKRVTTADTPSS